MHAPVCKGKLVYSTCVPLRMEVRGMLTSIASSLFFFESEALTDLELTDWLDWLPHKH